MNVLEALLKAITKLTEMYSMFDWIQMTFHGKCFDMSSVINWGYIDNLNWTEDLGKKTG